MVAITSVCRALINTRRENHKIAVAEMAATHVDKSTSQMENMIQEMDQKTMLTFYGLCVDMRARLCQRH